MRATPLSQMLLNNLDAFPQAQLEKIMSMEPAGRTMNHEKARFGKILDTSDFRTSGIELFKTRNKP